jgi:hypothetical protein
VKHRHKETIMKLKLGLLIGAAIGYLAGSGKGAEIWNQVRDRRSDRDATSRVTTGTFRSEEPVASQGPGSLAFGDLGDAAPVGAPTAP